MFQPRCIKLQVEGEIQILDVMINQPLTVKQLTDAEKSLCAWAHYAIVKHQGVRLPPATLLQHDVLYSIEIRKSKQIKLWTEQNDFSGGGPQLSAACLGDKIMWQFMQAMARHHTEEVQQSAPFMLYPFRARPFLDHHFPVGLRETWQQQFHVSSHSFYTIFEINHHWVLLVGK